MAQSVTYRTGEQWVAHSIPGFGQYSYLGLIIFIAPGFLPFSPQSIVLTMVMWESSQWLRKNIMQSSGKKNSRNYG